MKIRANPGERLMSDDFKENSLTDYNFVKEICHLYEKDRSRCASSFEGREVHISIVTKDDKLYIRSSIFITSAEGNGRPITNYSDILYPIDTLSEVNELNWEKITYKKFYERIKISSRSFEGVNTRLL